MNIYEMGHDHVLPGERLERCQPARPSVLYVWAFAVLMGLSAIYDNVRMRDQLAEREAQCAATAADKDREITLYKPVPQPMRCQDYTTSPYDQSLERACAKTVYRM